MRIERYLDELGSQAILAITGERASAMVRKTTDRRHGDYQLNAAMSLAKRLRKLPREIAAQLADELKAHPEFDQVEVAGPGFVNLRLSKSWIAERLIDSLRDRERDGVPAVDVPETVVVDFSSPNIAKQMHVGHLRSTIIGDSIVRLLRLIGHRVIGDNHLGDWGTQFGLLIVGMRAWGDEAALDADPIAELERVYRLASARSETDPDFAASARAELARLQAGDAENRALWEHFVATSRRALEQVYRRLDVTFDEWMGESAYHDRLPAVVQDLLARGLARNDAGAVCVFWNELSNVPEELSGQKEPFIVRKTDGAYLYATTDIAAALYRKERWHADRVIYVVDARQALHFRQLFALLSLMGVELRLEHITFGTVLDEHGKPLKTREGKAVTLAALLDEAEHRAELRIREGIAEKMLQIDESEVPEVARVVGIGAVKYADLRQNRSSDYQFDWDKMVSFKGNAGPYIQYAFARISSLFAKGGLSMSDQLGPVEIGHDSELELARTLLGFGEVVHQAAEGCLPHLVTDYLYDLARAFSAFYEACPVLRAEGATRQSRLALAALAGRHLLRGLGLLGIQVVPRM